MMDIFHSHSTRFFSCLKTFIIVFFLSCISANAYAQNFYGGIGIGSSDVDDNVADGLITSGTVDGEDSALKIFGGVELNKNLSLEISYIDLGETTYSGSFLGFPVTNGKIEITGINFGVVGMFPVNPNFSILGRVGLFMWDADASDITGGIPFSESDDGTDLSFGFGVNYDFTKQIDARAEWERFDAADADADLLSLSLVIKF